MPTRSPQEAPQKTHATQTSQQRSPTHTEGAHGRLFLQGLQRLSAEDSLHRLLDPPGHQRPAHTDRSRRRNLQFEPERTARDLHRPVVQQADRVDVRDQRRADDAVGQDAATVQARPAGPAEQTVAPLQPAHEPDPGAAGAEKVRADDPRAGHARHAEVLRRPESVQRLQVLVRRHVYKYFLDAVVRSA